MTRATSAILFALAVLLSGCAGDEPGALCPVQNDLGPAVGPGPHAIVASSLSEEWVALSLDAMPPRLLDERGLTGAAPNDLDVVGDRLLIVNSGENTVSVVDLPTGITTGCIDLGAGSSPWELTADPEDSSRAWVSTFLSGEIVELDLDRLAVVRRRSVGPAAEGILVTAAHVLVTLTGFNGTEGDYGVGRVLAFRKDDLAPVADLPVPTNPQTLLSGADGRIHVVCTGNYGNPAGAVEGQVVRIEADLSAVRDTLRLGGSPFRAAVDENGTAYVSAFFGGVFSYDTRTLVAGHTIDAPLLPQNGYSGVATRDGILYVGNFDLDALIAVRLSDGAIVGEARSVGDGPIAVALR